MKMTKSQLKEAVKAVVRECLKERMIKEIAPPGDSDDNASEPTNVESKEAKIVSFVLRKFPQLRSNPDKISRISALLFHHLEKKVANMDAIMNAVETTLEAEDQAANTPVSKTPEKPKVSKNKKKEEPLPAEEKGEKEEPKSEEEEENVDESTQTLPPHKGSYKIVAQPSTDEEEENKALTIQTDPEVNESSNTLPPNKGQYKTVAPHQYTTTDQNKALTVQTNPKVNEGPIKMSNLVREKNWIKGAVKHPGRCAHPGDSQCPVGSPQYTLAQRFKHGDIHKANTSEAGLTSETPDAVTPSPMDVEPSVGGPEVPPMGDEEHNYDEHEEIKLIKVVKKAADRLEAMHDGMPGNEEDPEIPIKSTFPSKPLDDTEPKKPTDGGEKTPAPKKDKKPESDKNEKNPEKKDKKKDKPVDENHKVQTRSFKTVNDLAQDPNIVRDPEVPGP